MGKIIMTGTRSRVIDVSLTAAGWTQSGDVYTQTKTVSGINASCEPLLVSRLASGATVSQQKAYNKAFGIICSGYGVTGADSVTFTVYKLPAVDITVGLKCI